MMAWIELHQSLWTHRKTLALADLLDIDETYAAAHMARLWTWALDNTVDGTISCNARVIAAAADWRGRADGFVIALIEAGWLDVVDDDTLKIHDWCDYSSWARKRANSLEARHRRRARLRNGVVERVNRAGVILRDASTCYLCGKVLALAEVTLDHVIPIARGGAHAEWNLRVACRPCNASKGAR